MTHPIPSEATCTLVNLYGKEGAEWAFALHTKIRHDREYAGSRDLMPKELNYFAELAHGKGGALFGCIKDRVLFGITAAVLCQNLQDATQSKAITYPHHHELIGNCAAPNQPVVVVQALCKERSRCDASEYLIRAAADYAKTICGAGAILAQVSLRTEKSAKRFEACGFTRHATWHTQADDKTRALMVLRL